MGIEIKSKEKLGINPVQIFMPQSILDTIVGETQDYAGIETAGFIFGLRYSSKTGNILIPLTCFTPSNKTDLKRDRPQVIIGGKSCRQYQTWAQLAWENIVKYSESNFKTWVDTNRPEFGVLGVYHSHPSGDPTFSPTDDSTVNFALATYPYNDFLFIINSPDKKIRDFAPLGFTTKNIRGKVTSRFYYRERERRNVTTIVTPNIVENNIYPKFSETPWYIDNEKLFLSEIQELQKIGYQLKTMVIPPSGKIGEPLLWFQCTSDNGSQLYIGTDHKFDKSGLAFFSTDDPTQKDFYKNGIQVPFKLKDYGAQSLSDIVGFYWLVSKMKK